MPTRNNSEWIKTARIRMGLQCIWHGDGNHMNSLTWTACARDVTLLSASDDELFNAIKYGYMNGMLKWRWHFKVWLNTEQDHHCSAPRYRRLSIVRRNQYRSTSNLIAVRQICAERTVRNGNLHKTHFGEFNQDLSIQSFTLGSNFRPQILPNVEKIAGVHWPLQ